MNDLSVRIEGHAGRITLNRPDVLNALTHEMCLKIEEALSGWATDPNVTLVLIDAMGDRAFCVGGDVVAIYNEGRKGRDAEARQFWRDEYRLNSVIAGYPKPFVALMDGIVMGGGVGLSAHGAHRVVSERTMFAMPECSLGLIPDVGGTYLLSQMPGYCGEYIGLTGARLGAADCIFGGLADYYVPSDRLDDLTKELVESGDVAIFDSFTTDAGTSWLADHMGEIDAVFGLARVADMQAMVTDARSEFARISAKGLGLGAPYSLRATLAMLREARQTGSLKAALRNEFRFVSLSVLSGEFLEGIRAALIDRDRNPHWKYSTLDSVPQALFDRLYRSAAGGDLII
jgi:enoyl-CoA hydratase/carnithine racemase